MSITEADVERTHRIGKLRDSDQKLRSIIVKFFRYNNRKNIFNRNKKLKGKNIAIMESLAATQMKKFKEKFTILKMFGHLTAKFYLRMDQEIQVCFMINPDLAGNRQRLYYGKRNSFYCFMFIFGYMWGSVY